MRPATNKNPLGLQGACLRIARQLQTYPCKPIKGEGMRWLRFKADS